MWQDLKYTFAWSFDYLLDIFKVNEKDRKKTSAASTNNLKHFVHINLISYSFEFGHIFTYYVK